MTTKEVIDILDETNGVIEETLDLIDQMKFPRYNKLLIAGVAIAGLATGLVVGYWVAKKRLEPKYAALADKEIEDAKVYYAKQNKTGEFADPIGLAKKYVEGDETTQLSALTEPYKSPTTGIDYRAVKRNLEEVSGKSVTVIPYDGNDSESEPESQPTTLPDEVINVFTESMSMHNWDYEEELRNRSEDRPYVISEDEFNGNERGYEQSSLTYYEDDDILSDETDKPVEDTDLIVGNDNLLRFGHGSSDNNIVYIRNEVLGQEFEIVRSKGNYSEIVLGFVEHSDHRPLRRFRNYDD